MPDVKTLAQLVRLPNVFTAVSNILAAYFLTHADLGDWPTLVLLVASSSCLYLAGMVLNDVYDAAVDAVERPGRPIPSGRVSVEAASQFGWGLLAAGVLFAAASSVRLQLAAPVVVASLLAVCVWLYDGLLKRTPLAPIFMGLCRTLNVLLGLSPMATDLFGWSPMFLILAGGVGVYVVGITWFARGEALEGASRLRLAAALGVMLAGTALIGSFPGWRDASLVAAAEPLRAVQMGGAWVLLWVLFGFFTFRRAIVAVAAPEPEAIQAAVKQAIFSIVIYDAAICSAARDPRVYGLAILCLLIPMNVLGRWVYST